MAPFTVRTPGQVFSQRFGKARPVAKPVAKPVAPAAPGKSLVLPKTTAPTPFDAALETYVSGVHGSRDAGIIGVAGEMAAVDRAYYDPNDPHSKANLLDKYYAQARLGTVNRAASQGMQYDGSTANAQRQDLSNYETQLHDMAASYAAEKGALQGRASAIRGEAADKEGTARYQSFRDFAADPTKTPVPLSIDQRNAPAIAKWVAMRRKSKGRPT